MRTLLLLFLFYAFLPLIYCQLGLGYGYPSLGYGSGYGGYGYGMGYDTLGTLWKSFLGPIKHFS